MEGKKKHGGKGMKLSQQKSLAVQRQNEQDVRPVFYHALLSARHHFLNVSEPSKLCPQLGTK